MDDSVRVTAADLERMLRDALSARVSKIFNQACLIEDEKGSEEAASWCADQIGDALRMHQLAVGRVIVPSDVEEAA